MIAPRDRRPPSQLSHVYPARHPGQRARAPRDRRLRRGRAGARVRHARLRGGRGRPARPGPLVRRRAVRAPRDYDVLFASKAFPCTAVYRVLAEEGLACDVASGGELSLALRGGLRPGADLLARQRQIGRRAARGARRRRGPRRARLLRRVRSAGADRRPSVGRTPGGADPRHARRGRRHPPRDLDRPGGLEVRLLAGGGARRRSSAWPAARTCDWWACTATSARSCSSSSRSGRRSGRSPTLGDFPVYNLGGGLGVAYTADQQPPRVEDYVEAVVGAVHEELGAGQAAAAGAGPGAGGQLDRHPLHRPDGQAQRVHLGGGRRRHVRQPAPDVLRLPLRGPDRRPAARRRRASAASWPASTASPAT